MSCESSVAASIVRSVEFAVAGGSERIDFILLRERTRSSLIRLMSVPCPFAESSRAALSRKERTTSDGGLFFVDEPDEDLEKKFMAIARGEGGGMSRGMLYRL